jgi:hypothetical protein
VRIGSEGGRPPSVEGIGGKAATRSSVLLKSRALSPTARPPSHFLAPAHGEWRLVVSSAPLGSVSDGQHNPRRVLATVREWRGREGGREGR